MSVIIILHSITNPGGYSDLVWAGCAADAAKPIPVFRGHFGPKIVPIFRDFIPKIRNFCPDFRDFIPTSNSYFAKILYQAICLEPRYKTGPVFRDFRAHKPTPCLRIFFSIFFLSLQSRLSFTTCYLL